MRLTTALLLGFMVFPQIGFSRNIPCALTATEHLKNWLYSCSRQEPIKGTELGKNQWGFAADVYVGNDVQIDLVQALQNYENGVVSGVYRCNKDGTVTQLNVIASRFAGGMAVFREGPETALPATSCDDPNEASK